MKHSFTFKLIDILDITLLEQFKKIVINKFYQRTNDFEEHVIKISHLNPREEVFKNFVSSYMSKYFKSGGHLGSNIARMAPRSYVSEHSDYTANTYGKLQDAIVKFQIPIITNPGAGMMWRHDYKTHSTAMNFVEGGIYIIDNCKVHSSVNFSDYSRYWLTSRWNIDSIIDQSILN
jgi:hypothetical protein